jgi:protein-tyrosine phosphatase
VNQIVTQLWITDIERVAAADTSRFDRVVSVCQDARPENVGCRYDHHALADDRTSEENWGGSSRYSAFAEAADTVLTALRDGETVLVHCHSGKNRSVAVSGAAMAVYDDTSFETFSDAVWQIKQSRPIANPNQVMSNHGKRFVDDSTSESSKRNDFRGESREVEERADQSERQV